MKKILMIIPYFLLWIFYFFLTQNERLRYLHGKIKGKHCIKIEVISHIPCHVTEFTYLNKPPEKEYLTWKQFWNNKGY